MISIFLNMRKSASVLQSKSIIFVMKDLIKILIQGYRNRSKNPIFCGKDTRKRFKGEGKELDKSIGGGEYIKEKMGAAEKSEVLIY